MSKYKLFMKLLLILLILFVLGYFLYTIKKV